MSFNRSIQMLTIVWNEKRFVESKSARNAARRSIYRASTIILNSEVKTLENQNDEICNEISRCHSDLRKYDDKLQILDNMTQLATQSLEIYFQARMENLRTFVTEQCRVISDGIQEEADHWKEIHAMLQQKLVVPGDLRSYGGGNGLPRAVKQSPNFSRIAEEEEVVEEEEEEKPNDVCTLLQSRTLTPLLTQTLKNARLLASKLSHETSVVLPPQLSISTTVHEETLMEEPLPPPSTTTIPDSHVTLRDVSVIEKAMDMDHDLPNPELSVSLLPCLPTTNPDEEVGEEEEEEEEPNNKSIASTISDKTFVKTSLKQFSSDEESDDDDNDDEDDDTIIEGSPIPDTTENARALLLTADRSIRRPLQPPPPPILSSREEKLPLSNQPILEKPEIKQEKVSFHEPSDVDLNRSNKTLLLNTSTFDAETSNYTRPTIVDNPNISKLPPIPSATTNEEEEEEEKDVVGPLPEKLIDIEIPITEEILCKNPIVEQKFAPAPVENNTKRRTTRRTTTRLLRESQNDNIPSQAPIEPPPKTRYATRYSTRLAISVTHEETTTSRRSTAHRRTTRFTSE